METAIQSKQSVNGKSIVLWTIKIAIAGMFLMAGGSKIAGHEQMVQLFNAIGVGQWFRYVTGLTELIGAVLVLVPVFAGFGALLLVGAMIGAILTHLFVIGGSPASAIVLLVGALIVLVSNKRQLYKILRK